MNSFDERLVSFTWSEAHVSPRVRVCLGSTLLGDLVQALNNNNVQEQLENELASSTITLRSMSQTVHGL